jgi:hypothetical protein
VRERRVVIDVGCASYGGDESIIPLVEEYRPVMLLGYDPAASDREYTLDGTTVKEHCAAAWIYDGTVGFTIAGLGGHVDAVGKSYPCVDLAEVIRSWHAITGEVILKLDCEGAEYTLAPYLHEQQADSLISKALIEWHCEVCKMGIWQADLHRDECPSDKEAWIARRDSMIALLDCPVENWAR